MSSPLLFTPISLGPLTLANRIMVSPMCQYSGHDGNANNWHLAHLGSLALSGAGLLTIEATSVSPEGRITPGCLGLYNDENERSLKTAVDMLREAHTPDVKPRVLAHGRAAPCSPAPKAAGKPSHRQPCRISRKKRRHAP